MNRIKLKDEEIVNIIKSGSTSEREKVLKFLYKQEKWRRTIKGLVINNKMGNEEDALDVLHEGFAKFEENLRLGKFNGNSKLDTYLIGICKNIWLRKLDKNTRYAKMKEALATQQPAEAYYSQTNLEKEERQMNEEERKKILHQLIDQLGEKCKLYLELYMQNYTPAQILAATDLKNETQARKSTYNCRMRLRKLILGDPKLLNFFKTGSS